MAKKPSKETKIKHRFGNMELRLSDVKVEVEEVVNRTVKHVYNRDSYEYGLFNYLLSEAIPTEKGLKRKTSGEIKQDIGKVEFLVYLLVYTNLIFSHETFRKKYWDLIQEVVQEEIPVDSPDDDKIIEELRAEHEAKEKLNEINEKEK